MCGIAGYAKSRGAVDNQILAAMGQQLLHRGPDNLGIFACGAVGAVHTRLSILDLSPAGNQPFRDEKHVLTYNGEIYNYRELKDSLTADGVAFSSSGDTTVLFESLVHRGVEATLRAARGMFAFCFIDLESQTIYLCRDRLGIKPLLWTQRGGAVYWASEAKAIAAVQDVDVDPVQAVFSLAGDSDRQQWASPFKGVSQVPPGCYLKFRIGGDPSVHRYHDILEEVNEQEYRELDGMTFEAVCERFRQLMGNSVRSMLMSDAPMGAFVSGGIDSSLIAALAVAENPELSLFTANVMGKYSEYSSAQQLAKWLGCELHAANFKPEQMMSDWVKCTYHYETPIITHTNSVPMAAVAALARSRGVKAVLTGEGSDELFLGYPKLLADRYLPFLRLPLKFLEGIYGLVPKLKDYVVPGRGENILQFSRNLASEFAPDRLKIEGKRAYEFAGKDAIRNQWRTVNLLRSGSLSALLHRNDRMGMQASIESRFPFLDEDVIRFGLNLPEKHKIRVSHRLHNIKHPFLTDKAVVRATAQKLLSPDLTHKEKFGFTIHGHQNVKVNPGYFANGYVSELFRMSAPVEDHMLSVQNRYFIGKLISLDVFGRLFSLKQSRESIEEHLQKHVSIEVA